MDMNRGAAPTSEGAPRGLVLTADKFEDMELIVPVLRLQEAGVAVDIAAPDNATIGGEHGYEVAPDLAFADVATSGYQFLLVPGGFPDGAPLTVRNDAIARQIAAEFMASGRTVATICHGPWLLVSADLVRGRRLTSYWHDGVPEEISAAGGHWVDEPVVVDGNLISSRWPPDLSQFTAALAAAVGIAG
jgi:protease I